MNKLFWIKLAHTLIWVFFVVVIFYVLYSGITGKINTYTWVGIGLVIGEGVVLLIFKMFCPLTILARKYSDSTKDNFDIFLPNWLAKNNKLIFTTIFYFVFSWFREQVCIIACPYGRLQGVLLDNKSIVVAYDHKRGEKEKGRALFKKNEDRNQSGRGDCIDCFQSK